MQKIFALLVVLGLAPLTAAAQDTHLTQFQTMNDARGWEAVGRIEIEGKGFCTGTLIAPDLVLTAAHCLFDTGSLGRVADNRLTFLAGFRDGRAVASRPVRRSVIPAAYVYQGPDWSEGAVHDLALLQLAQPIRQPGLAPMASAEIAPDHTVSILSYAHDRADAPSMQEVCEMLGRQAGVYVLTCSVDFGASGSPVFQVDSAGVARIVSVVSAKAMIDDQPVAIGAPLADLDSLRAELEAEGFHNTAPVGVRVIAPGERTEIGARFVRP